MFFSFWYNGGMVICPWMRLNTSIQNSTEIDQEVAMDELESPNRVANDFLTSLRSLVAALEEGEGRHGRLLDPLRLLVVVLLLHRRSSAEAQVRRLLCGFRRNPRHGDPHVGWIQVRGSASGVLLDLVQGYEVWTGEEEGNRGGLQGGRAEELVSKLMMLLCQCQKRGFYKANQLHFAEETRQSSFTLDLPNPLIYSLPKYHPVNVLVQSASPATYIHVKKILFIVAVNQAILSSFTPKLAPFYFLFNLKQLPSPNPFSLTILFASIAASQQSNLSAVSISYSAELDILLKGYSNLSLMAFPSSIPRVGVTLIHHWYFKSYFEQSAYVLGSSPLGIYERETFWLTLLYRIQVLANSLIATVLVVILTIKTQGQDKCLDTEDSAVVTALLGGIVGHYACCNGDTWSSELGMLSSDQPRLITTLKKVRKGTNGAVTIHGLVAAIAAGFAIGITFALIGLLTTECSLNVLWRQLLIVPIAAAAGLIGSLIDSLLGATLQFSGYCTVRKKVVGKHGPTVIKISGTSMLDNNAVNAVSILLTTLVTSITCLYIF
ncbi:hypothetical protein ZIOFF_004177 [Zingiber officinale]|uniref:Uncharacterized protein n=1 Tax=Zingiber officinale TaxID=94328 RepID=A0A8J5MB26_ZINOF|nr:hypothetical protein ZIOFF_004177 [Zingiber officinale]